MKAVGIRCVFPIHFRDTAHLGQLFSYLALQARIQLIASYGATKRIFRDALDGKISEILCESVLDFVPLLGGYRWNEPHSNVHLAPPTGPIAQEASQKENSCRVQ